jgi:hypothetical protein
MTRETLDMNSMAAAVRDAKQPEAQGRRISMIGLLQKNIREIEQGALLGDIEQLKTWLRELQQFNGFAGR